MLPFAYPNVLWALLLVPILAVYDHRWGLKSRARLRFSSFTLFEKKDLSSENFLWGIPKVLRLAALTFVILALARPQEGQKREERLTPATDIMLCVDTSTSMEALDFKPKNRLEGAKDVIHEFIENRPHDRIGMVVFSALAYTQCPLTLDHGALLGFLDNVKIGMIREDGTAIGTALAAALGRLKNSAAKSKIIILLTDGRNNRGDPDPLTAAKMVKAFGMKVYTVGVGAVGGSLYPVEDPLFGRRLVRLQEYLDEDTLRRIADATNALYFRATDMERLREIYSEIDQMEKTDIKVETFTEYRDLYFPFLVPAFILLSTKIFLSLTVLRRFP